MFHALTGRSGVGLIATHDLELTELAAQLAQARNYHFRETVVAHKLVFDYQIRPGPSPTSNALLIMAQEGLPVPPAAESKAAWPPAEVS